MMNELHKVNWLAWSGVLLLTVLAGCKTMTPVRVISVSPEEASPGMIVEFKADKPIMELGSNTVIEIGKQVAAIQSIASPTQANVLVPNLRQGKATIRLRETGKRPGKGIRLEVLPAPSLQLVLSWQENDVRLVRVKPRGGEFYAEAELGQKRVSYDVFNRRGGFVYTGSFVHPVQGRAEVFDEPEPGRRIIRGEPPPKAALFNLKVPHVPEGPFTIRFYEVPAGTDLSTLQGRAVRQFVKEIKVKP